MKSYDVIAPFYDVGTGDRSAMAALVRGWIRQRRPGAKRVLELACGTASMLKPLPQKWEVWGIDLSQAMLQQARAKVPRGHFLVQDITRFRLPQKFDAIICLLDSMNHLTRFRDWEQTFRRVREHLEDGGVFIFDVYTARKLRRLETEGPFVQMYGRDYLMVSATSGGRGLTNCSIRIFENVGHGQYRLAETEIAERAFPLARIRRALRKHFPRFRPTERDGEEPRSWRIVFTSSASDATRPAVKLGNPEPGTRECQPDG